MNCVVVDDEYLAIRILEQYISRIDDLTLKKSFKDPKEALVYLQKEPVDLLFLDIQMPHLDGFQLLSQLTHPPMIVFTTARHDYAARAFDLDVLDYLVKPFAYERFEKAVHKAKEYRQYRQLVREKRWQEKNFLMIRVDHQMVRVDFNDIEYIEGLSEYVKIYTSGKTHITLAALKDLLQELPGNVFVRIHKSFIVNLSCVASYNRQQVALKSGKELPVGRVYKEEFLKRIA